VSPQTGAASITSPYSVAFTDDTFIFALII
jgi:hypothetical protein